MPSDERMSVDERREYLKLVAPRYARADEKERSGLHVSRSCWVTMQAIGHLTTERTNMARTKGYEGLFCRSLFYGRLFANL